MSSLRSLSAKGVRLTAVVAVAAGLVLAQVEHKPAEAGIFGGAVAGGLIGGLVGGRGGMIGGAIMGGVIGGAAKAAKRDRRHRKYMKRRYRR